MNIGALMMMEPCEWVIATVGCIGIFLIVLIFILYLLKMHRYMKQEKIAIEASRARRSAMKEALHADSRY